MKPIRTLFHAPLLVTASLMLSACVNFGSKPPPQLLTITPSSTPAAGQSISSEGMPSLMVLAPNVPRSLDTTRVPVQVDPTTIAYVKNAQWTAPPRTMFRRLLAETIAAAGKRFMVSEEQYTVLPDQRLSGELIDFGIDARSHEAVVTFDAVIGNAKDARAVQQRFTARVPISKIKASNVAEPINQAANEVARQVAAWVDAN